MSYLLSCIVIVSSLVSNVLGVSLLNKEKSSRAKLEEEIVGANKLIDDLKSELEQTKKDLNNCQLSIENEIKEVSVTEDETKDYTITVESGVNIRKEPTTDSEVLGNIDYNKKIQGVLVENQEGTWLKMEDGFVCIATSSGLVLAEEIKNV